MAASNQAELKVEKFCPNCGAPVSGDSSNCKYCGAYLPGLAMAIEKTKSINAKTNLKQSIVDKAFDYLNDKAKREDEKREEIRKSQKDLLKNGFLILLMIVFFFWILPKFLF